MASPIEGLKSSRDQLISRFSRGELADAFQETYTEMVDQYFRRSLQESETGRKLFREKKAVALIAVGGYGRKDLSIHSDVDVMILFGSRIPPLAKGLAEEMFYPLWDIGLDLGHGTRSIKDCVDLAKQDFEVLTSLMDARFVCGDSPLYFSLVETLHKKAVSKKASFFSRWLEEQDRLRMATFGDASSLLEPNLKEGIGGLRDYHHILWLSKVFHRLGVPRDLEYGGIFSHREYAEMKGSLQFICLVRNHLHLVSGRKNDRLTFDHQERIARILGFRDHGDLLAVEQFLGKLHASMASLKSLRSSFALTHLPGRQGLGRGEQPESLSGSIELLHGEVGFTSATSILSHPHLLVEIFEWGCRLNRPLSLDARRLVREFLYLVDEDFRRSPAVVCAFLSILRSPHAFEALDQMDTLGFLGALIPEFENVRERVQFDSYHLYPVGTHLLQTVKNLKTLGREKNLLLVDIFSDLRRPESLLLAGLFHDLGKVGKNHARKGAAITQGILDRLACDREGTEDVLFLISHHLLLAETATRRDLNDEKVVVQCARTIGTIDRLKMLYLLTWADSVATGPRAWNEWIENLVLELFFKILHTLEKGELATHDASRRIKGTERKVRRALAGQVPPAELETLFEAMSPRYLLETESGDMIRHVHVFRAHREGFGERPSTAFGLEEREEPSDGSWEVLFMARDRPGLFSDVAGVLALNNINILSAHIYTWLDGTAVDIFRVSGPVDPIHPDRIWKTVKKDMENTFTGRLSLPYRLEQKSGSGLLSHPKKGIRPPQVTIDNDSSDFLTLIEVFADDRVGLLYLITHALFQLRLDIRIAKIATRGDQIADVFYVRDLDGQKVQDREQVVEIERAILHALKQG
ncbi:MAG: [protein-PII] uridylyltransferase [Deltaproteobacteria bacterium]|nr:[protein-PII] uridylyltransferase [Deltaproteobacteria bacterium]